MLLASLGLVAMVFRPLAMALFLAAVLAAAFDPIYQRLVRRLGGRERLAAAALVLATVIGLLAPMISFSAFLVKQAADGLALITATIRSQGIDGLLATLPGPLERAAQWLLANLEHTGSSLRETVQRELTSGRGTAAVGAVVGATGSFLFQTTLMLIALYFFLVQKRAILAWLELASPLPSAQTRELLVEFRKVTVAIVRSTVLTALVQTATALVGYLIARVPFPFFFAAVTFFGAMVPAAGAAAVCLAAALLLLLTGHLAAAVFLAAWGVLVVGLIDNVIKPLLIRGEVEMSGAVVFFALLGGLAQFGAIGLLLGPLAVALFVALLRIYRREDNPPEPPPNRV